MERKIGSTDLRQKLTDVLQSVREEKTTYVVETFGRPQAVLIDLDEYRRYQAYQEERHEFFAELDEIAARNAERNAHLGEEEMLALIEEARQEVYEEQMAEKQAEVA